MVGGTMAGSGALADGEAGPCNPSAGRLRRLPVGRNVPEVGLGAPVCLVCVRLGDWQVSRRTTSVWSAVRVPRSRVRLGLAEGGPWPAEHVVSVLTFLIFGFLNFLRSTSQSLWT